MIYFSKKSNAFYSDEVQTTDTMPDDIVEITHEQHATLLNAINTGCIVFDDLTVSPPCPDKYHTWNAKKGEWIEVKDAAELQLADKRAAMPDLTRVQLFKALYLSKKITEADIQAVIDKIEDKDQRTIAQIEFQTNAFERDNAVLIQAAHALGITDEEIDAMWEQATAN